MNKLSALVISVFLLLAVAMWYLANASFEQYLKNEISSTGKAATGFEVTSENILHSGSDLYIGTITISDNTKVLVKLSAIEFKVDKKSFKEDVLIIDELSIGDLNVENLDPQTSQSLLHNLSTYLSNNVINTADNESQTTRHNLPIIAIKQVNVVKEQQKQAIMLNSSIMEKGIEARHLFVEIVKLLTSQSR